MFWYKLRTGDYIKLTDISYLDSRKYLLCFTNGLELNLNPSDYLEVETRIEEITNKINLLFEKFDEALINFNLG